ncbi:MAG: multiprotein bridging factor aMBF1 [Candidatus Methanoplasma sp.]|nr:multiprotein bridging factor aMBF1 [Candidatus Methanoplasma sp.]
MICEMCGKEAPTRPMLVEGIKLSLCPDCAKFGDEYKSQSSPLESKGAPVNRTVIEARLQKREKRMQTRDVYSSSTSLELMDDYGRNIREAREAKGMDLEEFGKSISEKKGILAKIEANDLIPDDKMIAKLEKALGIKLREQVQTGGPIGGGKSGTPTLADFIKKK